MLSKKFNEALEYATNLHRGHVRKGTEIPYVCHLLSVCGLVLEYEGDERTAIAALLHDALEDHWRGAQTQEEIRDRFGEEVLTVVLDCGETGEHTSGNWRERNERYIEHLRYASHPALLVSACDKLHNIRAILRDYKTHGANLWERFNASQEDILWYYRGVVAALKHSSLPKRLFEELETPVTDLEYLSAGTDQ